MDSRDKFAQMLREGYEALDPEKEQREYIRELLRQKEQQRKRSIKTITAVAAVFLIVVGAVLAVGGCFGSVEADKNDRTKVEEQDGSTVIKGENTEDEEIGSEVAKVTDWDGIAELKEQYPEMITFTDVPKGMEFVSVEAKERSCNMINISYCFSQNDNNILVLQEYYTKEKQQTQLLESTDEYIEYKGYKIIIKQESKKLIATVNDKKCMFDVIGSITEDEVFDILDKIKAS